MTTNFRFYREFLRVRRIISEGRYVVGIVLLIYNDRGGANTRVPSQRGTGILFRSAPVNLYKYVNSLAIVNRPGRISSLHNTFVSKSTASTHSSLESFNQRKIMLLKHYSRTLQASSEHRFMQDDLEQRTRVNFERIPEVRRICVAYSGIVAEAVVETKVDTEIAVVAVVVVVAVAAVASVTFLAAAVKRRARLYAPIVPYYGPATDEFVPKTRKVKSYHR